MTTDQVDLDQFVRGQYVAVGRVLDLHDEHLPPLIVAPDIRNAHSEDGVIRYNPAWVISVFERMKQQSTRVGFLRGLWAHELAHHLDRHGSDEVLLREQFADVVAGMVLGIMESGVTPYIRLLSTLPPSPNHPTLRVRVARLVLGKEEGIRTRYAGLEAVLHAGSALAFGAHDHDMRRSAAVLRSMTRAAAAAVS